MIANLTFYICSRNKVSGPGAGTNKAIQKLRALHRLVYTSPGDRLKLFSYCHELILFALWNGNEGARRQQTNTRGGGGGGRAQVSVSNCTGQRDDFDTSENGAGGGRPRDLDGRWRRGLVPGSLLSKWNKSCQLSKSVRCPPQAWAYRAHLSPSCLCLLISMCIFLSLSPKGGILGPALNANYNLAT